jgi:hypothetical protein
VPFSSRHVTLYLLTACLPNGTAPHPRGSRSSATPLWEPHISHSFSKASKGNHSSPSVVFTPLNRRAAYCSWQDCKTATVDSRTAERTCDQTSGECLCGPTIKFSKHLCLQWLRFHFLVSDLGEGWGVRFESDCEVSDSNISAKSQYEEGVAVRPLADTTLEGSVEWRTQRVYFCSIRNVRKEKLQK